MKLFIVALASILGNFATVVKAAETFQTIQDFSDNTHVPYDEFGGRYLARESGIFKVDYNNKITGSFIQSNSSGGDVSRWQDQCDGDCTVIEANSKYLITFVGRISNDRDSPWTTSAIVARNTQTGKQIWEKKITNFMPTRVAKIASFRGKEVVVTQSDRGLELLDLKTGSTIANIALPESISPLLFSEWGRWSSEDTSQKYVYLLFGDGDITYWAFPGGIIAATSGDKTLWKVDFSYRTNDFGKKDSIQSFVSGMVFVGKDKFAVGYRTGDDQTFSPTAIIQANSGTVIQNLPHATSIASDKDHFYLRQDRSVVSYDAMTLAKLWESPVRK
ncbi:MAG: PQQ-binding-like beta-propeller repeat protein, partial [Proteobacteria bacterium]|nr:PQQ-binding-like beta-propeller repeat protein [Pseudomonadota bacterium]